MANTRYICVDVYTVKAGDTVYSIAGAYDIPVALLMKANGMNNPYNLRIGTKLCIPGLETDTDYVPECRGVMHTVAAGDTLYMIAKLHKVSLDAIIRANPNVDPYNLRIGTKLCIPTADGTHDAPSKCPQR